jgi:glycosyltransferase involved in cell wall biosynthesis
MIRVAFVMAYADQGWMGGINYLSNLLHSIMLLPDRQIQPVLIVPPDVPDRIMAGFPKTEMLTTRLVDYSSKLRLFRKAGAKALGRDWMLEQFLRSHRIDVLSHSDHLGATSKIPTICWIPDFQHRRMPEFFQPQELSARDKSYRDIAKNCTTLVLSSHDAQSDLKNFIPDAAVKSQVLNFVSGVGGGAEPTSLDVLLVKYGINLPYIHLPNQFWAHKNHAVVIEALGILKERQNKALVLSTGHTQDHRQPGHFDRLMSQVQKAGLQDYFRPLGLVPYEDLSGLMRHSAAVLNPSLFEGWSTTVEESKSLGKTIILSDIPVHREQAPEFGLFFDPKNPSQLADVIEEALTQWNAELDQERWGRAQNMRQERFFEFGRRYQEIVLATCHV